MIEANDLKRLLCPKSIAVVGESKPVYAGNHVARLREHKYAGQVYPVNPSYDEICGYKCYPDVSELPEGIDCAVIKVRSDLVVPVAKKCFEKKFGALAVITAGFAEVGREGEERQRELVRLANENNAPILGPNCIGFANLGQNIIAFGNTGFGPVLRGDVALVSQSGGLGSMFNRAQEKGLGFSYLISCGNEGQIGIPHFIDYLAEDDSTRAVIVFMECIRDAQLFMRSAEKALRKGKPVVVLKVGRSEIGKKASVAHTAALIGGDDAYRAAFRQLGIVTVEDIDELIDTAFLFSSYELPRGNSLGVLGISGGASTLLADHAERLGFSLPELPPALQEKMSVLKFGTPMNPLDLTGQVSRQPELFVDSLKMFAQEEAFDSVVATVTPPPESFKPRAEAIIAARNLSPKPYLVLYTGAFRDEGVDLLRANRVAAFDSAGKCLKNLSHLVWYAGRLRRGLPERLARPSELSQSTRAALTEFSRQGTRSLSEFQLSGLLEPYGIKFAREGLAKSWDECRGLAGQICYPVALKALSPEIIHKTDQGCLILGLEDEATLSSAYEEVLARARAASSKTEGILVQEMVPAGREVILGIHRDPIFGPVIMVGLGGILTELLADVAFGIPPLADADIQEMLDDLKGARLLKGFRGSAKADLNSLVEAIRGLSQFAVDCGDMIGSMDINPILVRPEGQGSLVVDAYLELS